MSTHEFELIAPGLFENGKIRDELRISPELFQEHLEIAAALPRNVTKLSAVCHDGYITVTAEVTQKLRLFLNLPEKVVFTVSIEEFTLSHETRQCLLKLDGPIADRGKSFVVQLAVTLVEDLVIFLLRGKRERFADQFTESRFEWPLVEVNLGKISEVEEVESEDPDLWNYITISNAMISENGISISLESETVS